ncbi:MAG: hypothetical protein WD228_09940 [Mycobacterium sp.]
MFADAIAHSAAGTPLLFSGFDALLHQRPAPQAEELDRIFADRVAIVVDNSGHGVYFNTALMKSKGWDVNPPADPPGAHFGRNPDGSLNGQGFEAAVLFAVVGGVLCPLRVSMWEVSTSDTYVEPTSFAEHRNHPDGRYRPGESRWAAVDELHPRPNRRHPG